MIFKYSLVILFLFIIYNSNNIVFCKNNNYNQKLNTIIPPNINVPTYSIKLLSNNVYSIYSGNDSSSIAQAAYTNNMMSMGWGYLSITTNPLFSDNLQAESAGYIEGYLSYEMIWQNWYNILVNEYNNNTVPNDIVNWIQENIIYMKQQITENSNDPYWAHISLIWSQLNGMVDGYNAANTDSNRQLTIMEFAIINADADLGDITTALNLSISSFRNSFTSNTMDHIKKTDHCSGLIKLTDDLTELYSGHTSWSSYFNMLRIFKSYNFKFKTLAKSQLTIFSGYPATLASLDDYYLLDTRLVVLETTNGLNNNDLYNLIKPQSILTWMRVIVANRIAHNGLSWCQIFQLENSGTYNNQWMIIDYNKFVPGVKVRDGTLYVLEQIPGYIEYADLTNILRTGYFASYNLPYFETVFNMSGFNDQSSSSGYEAYEEDVRSQIFRRDANSVYSLNDFQSIMRYNNYQNDPLSHGDAANQISSRFDLNSPSAEDYDAFGGVDSKITSLQLVNQLLVLAQSGPTHDQEPPFEWSSGNWSTMYPTIGMPNLYNFTWVTFSDTSYSINN